MVSKFQSKCETHSTGFAVCQCHWVRLCFVRLLSLEKTDVVCISPNNNAIALIISSASKRISIKMLAQTHSLHMFNTCSCCFLSNWDEKNVSLCLSLVFGRCSFRFVLLILWNFTEIQWRFAMLSCHLINWLKLLGNSHAILRSNYLEKKEFDANCAQHSIESAMKISSSLTQLVIYHPSVS